MKDETARYVALANLKTLDRAKGKDHIDEFWHIVRALAVLDWTLRQPVKEYEEEREMRQERTEERFETIMRKVQALAREIQEEQGYKVPQLVH